MGISPAQLFEGVGLRHEVTVPWMTPVPLHEPGVYVISTNEGAEDGTGPGPIRLSEQAVKTLLMGAPNPKVLGQPADYEALTRRLANNWFEEEPVVYIGLAKTSVRDRIGAFYRTKIGAPRPHAGGWFLKMLGPEVRLWVHAAPSETCVKHETALLDAFVKRLSAESTAKACDPRLPLPYANLERTPGERKAHGISGVIQRRRPSRAVEGPA